MQNDAPILIVDDSAIVRQTVKNTLSGMGFNNVFIAANGKEALEKTKERLSEDTSSMFKVIILDRNMPELDGLSFLKILRDELHVQDAAVIILTAYSDSDSIITALESGATCYAIKPVSPQTIEEKMNRAIEWLNSQKKENA